MRKIFSFILTIIMLFNIVMPLGIAQASTPEVVIDITAPATALRGQEVLVSVSAVIAAGTDIQGIQTDFAYSDNFPELVEENTKIVENTTSWTGLNCDINSFNLLAYGDINADGGTIIGQLAFKIPENAAFDTVYTVSFDWIEVMALSGILDNSKISVPNTFASVKVVPLPPVEGISVEEYQGEYDGDEHTISVDIPDGATIKYSEDGDTYSLDLPPVYKNAGEYTVYYVVSKEGNSDTFGSGRVSIEQKELEDRMIDAISPQQYTGSQITPSITVTDGSPSIITADDYTISYGSNVNVADRGTVTIAGKGNYKGSAVAYFDILPITMEVTETDYDEVYDGNAHTAQVNVTKPANAQIKFGTEEGTYTLDSMPEYTNAGTYTIYYKATAENYLDYTGSVKVIIKPKTLTEDMVEDIPSFDYTGSQITPRVTVSDVAPCVITENDYTVSYGDNINVTGGGSVTITGEVNYTGTVQKTFVINPIAMTVSASGYEGVYDGELHGMTLNVEIPDTATVKYGTSEADCTLEEMPKYKDVGTYTVYYKVTDPNYIENKGSAQIKINPKELTASMVGDISDMPYTGSQIKPDVTVSDVAPCVITENDYTVSYGDNINVEGGGTVTIEGKGNYQGSITKEFDITPIEMTVSTSNYEGTYDGEYHSATVSISDPQNAVIRYGLTEGTYDLDEMPTFINANSDGYTVYYKATAENYIDKVGSVKVVITPKAVTADMISDMVSYPYTGSQIIPVFTVSDVAPCVITENDYTVSYGDNVNVEGGGSVTITGEGNYTGTATKGFAITPIDMTVEALGYSGTYDGENHTVSITVSEPASVEIRYGTVEGTYDLQDAPQYKNAGNYIVYYKITADNYNEVSGALNVDISRKTLTEGMVENITAQEFTGEQITPQVTLRDTLPCEITANDYVLSYGTNITVAEGGSVIVEGRGNYTGTVTKYFEIANAVLRTEETDYEGIFDGASHSASLMVTNCDTATVLYGSEEGTYDLSEMPVFTNAGNYVVYYKATAENYSDCTGSLDVVITPKELTDEMVGDIGSYTYTSAQITPAVTVTDEEATITTEDYDVVYGENINVIGGGTVTVNAKRNYTGSIEREFEITKVDLNITSESKEITYGDAFDIPVNYSGFVGSETKANLISEALVTGFSESPDAGIYDIILSGAQSDNYNIIYGTDYTLTVNKKNISLTSINVFDKAYDETTNAVINETSAVLDGVISGDVVLVDLSLASANFATAQVGDGISVEITGLAITGEDAGNYTLLNDTYTTTASIKPAITAADIAAQITSIVIDRNTTNLVMPIVPEGFVISLKSSTDETVVDLNGVIYTGDTDTPVDLVFTVTSEDGTDFADTIAITATVPAHDKYQITVTAQSNGSVGGSGLYVKNTSATITATADSGYKFDGWYSGEILVSSNASYTFTVTEALSLVAKFSAASSGGGGSTNYTVKFVANGGTEIKNIRISKNKKIGNLPVPEREGYTFAGWYIDQALTKVFDEDSTITKAITLYAKWEKKASLPEEEKPTDYESAFSDVNETAWYYDAVKYVVEKGLFKGISDTEFAPNSPLTRGMLVTVLYRAEQQPKIEYEKSFDDVSEGNYYSNAVIWAAKNGIVSGISDNEFMPDNNISREQIATIIYRYAKFKGIDNLITSQIEYADKMQISDWAADAIAFCKSMSIMTGNDVNEFMPRANATRAEVAATLQRFFKAE